MSSLGRSDVVKNLMAETKAFSRRQQKPIPRGSKLEDELKELLKDVPSDIRKDYTRARKAGFKRLGILRQSLIRAAFKNAVKANKPMSKNEAHDIMRALLHSLDRAYAAPRDISGVNNRLPFLVGGRIREAEAEAAANKAAADKAAADKAEADKAEADKAAADKAAATEKARDAIIERARRKKIEAEAKGAEKAELQQKAKKADQRASDFRAAEARQRRAAARRSRLVETQRITQAGMARALRAQEAKEQAQKAIDAERGRVVVGPDLRLRQRVSVPPRMVAPIGASGPADMAARGPKPRSKRKRKRRKKKAPEQPADDDDVKEVADDASVPAEAVREAQSRGLGAASAASFLGLAATAAVLGTAAYRRLFPVASDEDFDEIDLEKGLQDDGGDDGEDGGDGDLERGLPRGSGNAVVPDDVVGADWKDALNAYFSLKRNTPTMDRAQKAELKKRIAKVEGANPELVAEINKRVPGFILGDRLTSLRGHQFAGPGTDMRKVMAITADPITNPDGIPSFIPVNSLDMATLKHDIYYSFGTPEIVRLADELVLDDMDEILSRDPTNQDASFIKSVFVAKMAAEDSSTVVPMFGAQFSKPDDVSESEWGAINTEKILYAEEAFELYKTFLDDLGVVVDDDGVRVAATDKTPDEVANSHGEFLQAFNRLTENISGDDIPADKDGGEMELVRELRQYANNTASPQADNKVFHRVSLNDIADTAEAVARQGQPSAAALAAIQGYKTAVEADRPRILFEQIIPSILASSRTISPLEEARIKRQATRGYDFAKTVYPSQPAAQSAAGAQPAQPPQPAQPAAQPQPTQPAAQPQPTPPPTPQPTPPPTTTTTQPPTPTTTQPPTPTTTPEDVLLKDVELPQAEIKAAVNDSNADLADFQKLRPTLRTVDEAELDKEVSQVDSAAILQETIDDFAYQPLRGWRTLGNSVWAGTQTTERMRFSKSKLNLSNVGQVERIGYMRPEPVAFQKPLPDNPKPIGSIMSEFFTQASLGWDIPMRSTDMPINTDTTPTQTSDQGLFKSFYQGGLFNPTYDQTAYTPDSGWGAKDIKQMVDVPAKQTVLSSAGQGFYIHDGQ